jgi:hypothetical protein
MVIYLQPCLTVASKNNGETLINWLNTMTETCLLSEFQKQSISQMHQDLSAATLIIKERLLGS